MFLTKTFEHTPKHTHDKYTIICKYGLAKIHLHMACHGLALMVMIRSLEIATATDVESLFHQLSSLVEVSTNGLTRCAV